MNSNQRTPARIAFPKSPCPAWLDEADRWSERTGIDLLTLEEHELPCVGCDAIIDLRDLANVFEHEHVGYELEKGVYLGAPVTPRQVH